MAIKASRGLPEKREREGNMPISWAGDDLY